MNARVSSIRAWLQLARPPNLLTVPGDPLAGFCLAGGAAAGGAWPAAAHAALAALLIYIGGLIGNDVADAEEDLRLSPWRPIPAGRIARRAAFAASALFAALGILTALPAGAAACGMACLAQLAVMLYNGLLKKRALAGALAMGACRGCSLLIGAAAADGLPAQTPALIAAAGLALYTAGVTRIAHRETEAARIGPARWLPCAALAAMFFLLFRFSGFAGLVFPAPAAFAAAWSWIQGRKLAGVPQPRVVGPAVGALIRGLLPVQAALISLRGDLPALLIAAGLLALWPLNAALAKRFAAT